MKRRTALAGAATALAAGLAGCSSGDNDTTNNDQNPVEPGDNTAGERTSQSLRLTVGEDLADSEWQSVSATYPRDRFVVQSAQHEAIGLGVDSSGDGNADEEFEASAISGVNNNNFSFSIELDTGYTLMQGDTVLVEYPAVDNPSEPGEYEVEMAVNEVRTETATITIE
ncbi:hypothetical protein KM295_12340 [Natronomonas sp. F2-12]|uniref:Uncharacterized protein n=1 Tax=Natronomonas aquatica TaxID=2841590 RepID=A0A9R1CS30_9EURY|nr:hypothetical protein [Natronomonas aquatica]MCQ4334253.1 hypothetical protein [Natronomonas aquatica]